MTRLLLPVKSGRNRLSVHGADPVSLSGKFIISARQHSDQLAIITDRSRLTYAELAVHVRSMADQLLRLPNWRPGDRVALQLNNSPLYVSAFFAVLTAGGVVVPLPPDLEKDRKETVLSMVRCRALLSDDETNCAPTVTTFSYADSGSVSVPASLAAIFFTSGSTGTPKGVMLSHQNLISNAEAIAQYLEIDCSDRALGLLPFFHAFGNSVLQSHLLAGATLVISGTVTYPESVMTVAREHAVTSLSGVPDFFRALLKHTTLGTSPLPALRYMAAAGGALRPDIAQEVASRIHPAKLYLMYGQTEATARLSYLPPEELNLRSGSIGRGIPGVNLEVVDEEGGRVAPGEVGQIRASGPGIMLGYWDDVEGTQAVLRDGWLYTGDLATIDDDGFVYPRGRANTLCKIAGYRVHPAEVEDVVASQFPQFETIAVPFETSAGGTRLALYLTATVPGTSLEPARVRALCQSRLPHHLIPARIEILDQWPLTSACKVDRAALALRASRPEMSSEKS